MNESNITAHFSAHQHLVQDSLNVLQDSAEQVAKILVEALQNGRKVIAFGNGGSAAQASHLAGELIGRFARARRPLPAITLVADPSTVTCISNDFGFEALFERQVEVLVQPGDVVLGLTTSGQSKNVRRGLIKARERRAVTVALTGAAGLPDDTADYVLAVPSTSTASIQEVHLLLLHAWCACLDEAFSN